MVQPTTETPTYNRFPFTPIKPRTKACVKGSTCNIRIHKSQQCGIRAIVFLTPVFENIVNTLFRAPLPEHKPAVKGFIHCGAKRSSRRRAISAEPVDALTTTRRPTLQPSLFFLHNKADTYWRPDSADGRIGRFVPISQTISISGHFNYIVVAFPIWVNIHFLLSPKDRNPFVERGKKAFADVGVQSAQGPRSHLKHKCPF